MSNNYQFASIIQEPSFSQKLDSLYKQYPRMHDVHRALDWLLARSPKKGIAIDNLGENRYFTTTPIGNTPSFWVLYHYDESKNVVTLLSITPVPDYIDDE